MAKYSLSKSTYIKGLQCLKYLYLYKKHYNLQDKLTAQKLSTFRRGTEVGILAHKLFDNGIDVSPKSHFKYEDALKTTMLHIEKNTPVLYEASFKYDDILIFLDILVKEDDGWHAYEVKSSQEITETYLHDASLQYYVIHSSGLKLTNFSLITVDKDYVRGNTIDVHKLFKITSVGTYCIMQKDFVIEHIKKQKEILSHDKVPEIDIGMHCFKPYDCQFMGYCWEKNKNNPLLNASTDILTSEEKIYLYNNQGQAHPQSLDSLNIDNERLIKINCHIQKKAYKNIEALTHFLMGISTNFCYLDLQCLKPAVPLFENNKAYENFPFLLIISENDINKNDPDIFLCSKEKDDRIELVQFLIEKTKNYDTVIVYDIDFIKESLHDLIQENDLLKAAIDVFLKKAKALKQIFTHNLYYSHKIISMEYYFLLTSLNLRNPYPQKDKINNSFEAHDAFRDYVCSSDNNNSYKTKERLFEFGKSNIRYLSRLLEWVQKNI